MKDCIGKEYANGDAGNNTNTAKKSEQSNTCRKKTAKKREGIDLEHLTPQESLKLEIAAEIGVYDKVMQGGWKSLTSKESGRIGGIMTKRKKEAGKQASE